jgi:hypothetical protein
MMLQLNHLLVLILLPSSIARGTLIYAPLTAALLRPSAAGHPIVDHFGPAWVLPPVSLRHGR